MVTELLKDIAAAESSVGGEIRKAQLVSRRKKRILDGQLVVSQLIRKIWECGNPDPQGLGGNTTRGF